MKGRLCVTAEVRHMDPERKRTKCTHHNTKSEVNYLDRSRAKKKKIEIYHIPCHSRNAKCETSSKSNEQRHCVEMCCPTSATAKMIQHQFQVVCPQITPY